MMTVTTSAMPCMMLPCCCVPIVLAAHKWMRPNAGRTRMAVTIVSSKMRRVGKTDLLTPVDLGRKGLG